MPDIDHIRAEIEHMRVQVYRQRGEIRQLQRAGIPTASAEALLDRMLNNIDGLCAERDRDSAVKRKGLTDMTRRIAMYFAWDRTAESNAPLGELDNRFPALFEVRRLFWPWFARLTVLVDAQGIEPWTSPV